MHSQEEAEAHMDTGKYVQANKVESVYDTVKKMWADEVTEMNLVTSGGLDSVVKPVPSTSSQYSAKRGWALKSTKRGTRMGEKARSFLIEKFTEGVSGGPKADANEVAKEMKVLRGKDDALVFQPDEWRTAKKITSFFSRLAALQCRSKAGNDGHGELDEEDLLALENKDVVQSLHEAVIADMEGTVHPIMLSNINVCDLACDGNLNKLKKTTLKSSYARTPRVRHAMFLP